MHLTAERGWVNDPLAPTWDGSRYHLFFQYVPDSTQWRTGCHWGHAVSDDLLHWRELDVALAPGDGDDGVWSGSLVRHPGGWRIFYTSVDAADQQLGRVRWADSPTLDGPWTKGEVVAETPRGLGVTAFRDPFVVAEPGGWRMLVGLSLDHAVAAVATWSSPDLSRWTYEGLAASRPSSQVDPVWTGSLWECPQLVEVGGRRHLVVSAWHDGLLHHVAAAPAGPDPTVLAPAQWQQLTAGSGYYAPASFVDAEGEPGLVFWLRGLHDDEAVRAGALSVPHRLGRNGDRLVLRLHPAVTTAARSRRDGSNAALAEPSDLAVAPFRARAGGATVLTVSYDDGRVVVEVGETRESVEAPSAGVQVLVDGPCTEVVTLGGAVAHTLPGPTWWDDDADGASWRWLP
ncbi:beta-fructofuranosidase [Pedococcus dokdonensis]|uniref:beta-fructofuranosidase n=1 Tax=Pedococcus dokdonensis TaxID=443156 RepID=A0A1H0MSB2_9MICO|nr:beta-fructofuranosidase [Pedococcus dokdonensis]